jgi:ribonucleoside-diphosphate reductase alpha chain
VPFEVWVNGSEQPRGLGAVAKTLSMDMRAQRQGLPQAQARRPGQDRGEEMFDMPFPPHGEPKRMPGIVAALAQVVRYRVEQLAATSNEKVRPRCSTPCSACEEPKTGTDGTLSWTVDISNPASGEEFVLGLKEITLPDGVTRPYSMWLSGNYPRALDGSAPSSSRSTCA